MNLDLIMKLNTVARWAEHEFDEDQLISIGNICFGLAALRNKDAAKIISKSVINTLEVAERLRQDRNVIKFPTKGKK